MMPKHDAHLFYLDDIFTIDNPAFVEHIPDTYPREPQLNKANTSEKETSFLDLNIKGAKSRKYQGVFEVKSRVKTWQVRGIGNYIHTSDKRDDFLFPIVNFPWLNCDVPRLPSHGIYISQLFRFASCCTSDFGFPF